MSNSLEGINVKITLELTGWFETAVPITVNSVTVGSGYELDRTFSSRILSDTDGNGTIEPVQGPNGLLTGRLIVDISGNSVFAQFSGQAQPAGFRIKIENLAPTGAAPGTVAKAGQMNGVNIVSAPTYSAQTKVLELNWTTLGFQPGTTINQTVFYDNKLDDPPVAVNDTYSINVGQTLTGANLLANDSDLDNLGSAFGIVDILSVSKIDGQSFTAGSWIDLATGGQIKVATDGKLEFREDGDFSDLARGVLRATSFQYTVSDSTGLTATALATINVTGVNSPASIAAPVSVSTTENSASVAIAGVKITDVDNDNQTVTISVDKGSLTLATTAGLSGDLNGSDGTLSFSGSLASVNAALAGLAFTPTPNQSGTATLNVQTNDGRVSTNKAVSIDIADVAPVLADQTVSLAENTANGTGVALVAATGDTNGLTYSIVSGNSAGAFSINASTGQITVADAAKLNFETSPTFALTVGVDDEDAGTAPNATAVVTINLTDVNEKPTGLSLSTATIMQSAALAGASIGTFSSTDPDAGSTFTYALVSGFGDTHNNRFTIDGDTLKAAGDLAPGNYNVFVRTTDAGDLFYEKALLVSVKDDVAPTIRSVSAPDAPLKIGDQLTVTIEAGETGLRLQSGTVNGKAVTGFTDKGNGSYTAVYTVSEGDASHLAGEDIPVSFVLKDAAGNLSSAFTTAISNTADAIDAERPTAHAPSLAAASDTGLLATDGITNAASQTFEGTAEDGATVELLEGATVLASTIVANGAWSATATLGEGQHTIQARVIDAGGNSAISTGTTVTVDRTAPTANDDSTSYDLRTNTNVLGKIMDNDHDAQKVVAINGAGAKVGVQVAGSNGGAFVVAEDGSVTFDPGSAFTDLASGATRTTGFSATVSDIAGNTATSAYDITVTGKNDAPLLVANNVLSVTAGNTATISNSLLKTTDIDDGATDLRYEVMALPSQGSLKLNGVLLAVGDGFTQADIDAGRLQFTAGSTPGAQTFGFSVADGGEDGVSAILAQSFAVNVAAAPSVPSTPSTPTEPTGPTETSVVGGVPVSTQTTTQPDGTKSQTVTIPTVTTGNNGAAVEIPVVKAADGSSVLAVEVPQGVGLTVSGATAPTSPAVSTSQFASQLNAHLDSGSADQAGLLQQGTKFLSALPQTASVLVQTIVPTIQPGAGTAEHPLVISGASGDGATVTALVLDTRGLPPGTVIELKNVAFAAVVGDISLTGGEGSQTVFADSGSQYIFLGADDDELHGGGGDDIIGSAGGDDRIFGDAGNDIVFGGSGKNLLHGGADIDTARYSGKASDYIVTQHFAVVTITSKADPTQVDTLVNVEKIAFSDGTQDIAYNSNLQWIAGLYKQVFARQADIGGIQAWAEQNAAGLNAGNMAMQFLRSQESLDKKFVHWGADGAPTIELLYEALLHRNADAAGLAYWQDARSKGGNLTDIAAAFVLSPEMQSLYNMPPTQWDFIA